MQSLSDSQRRRDCVNTIVIIVQDRWAHRIGPAHKSIIILQYVDETKHKTRILYAISKAKDKLLYAILKAKSKFIYG